MDIDKKELINMPQKSAFEIISFLLNNLDCVEHNEVKNAYYDSLIRENIVHSSLNENSITKDKLNIKVYDILDNQKSERYYREGTCDGKGVIYVIIETSTGYILSNSNLLFLELMIYRGIDIDDYKNETQKYQYYISYIEKHY